MERKAESALSTVELTRCKPSMRRSGSGELTRVGSRTGTFSGESPGGPVVPLCLLAAILLQHSHSHLVAPGIAGQVAHAKLCMLWLTSTLRRPAVGNCLEEWRAHAFSRGGI